MNDDNTFCTFPKRFSSQRQILVLFVTFAVNSKMLPAVKLHNIIASQTPCSFVTSRSACTHLQSLRSTFDNSSQLMDTVHFVQHVQTWLQQHQYLAVSKVVKPRSTFRFDRLLHYHICLLNNQYNQQVLIYISNLKYYNHHVTSSNSAYIISCGS